MKPHQNTPNQQKIIKEIGRRISIFRKISGLSREELSTKIDLCPKMLLKYETGKSFIPLDKLIEIAEVMGVQVVRFFHK